MHLFWLGIMLTRVLKNNTIINVVEEAQHSVTDHWERKLVRTKDGVSQTDLGCQLSYNDRVGA